MDSSTLDLKSQLLAVRLPALPQVLVRLMHISADDNTGLEELAELVAQDAALVAKVLQVASSAAYSRASQPANLLNALNLIGLDMVRTLLMTQSVYQTFHEAGGNLDLRHFWVDALSTAITARMLARREDYPFPEEAYLGGLLHDIGRLAMVVAAPQQYTANFFSSEGAALCALEERTLEITHAEAGAMLLERMDLDSFIADGVRYHHAIMARLEHAHPLVRLIALAAQLVNANLLDPAERALLLEQAGLSARDYDAHAASLAKDVKDIAASLGIALPLPGSEKAASDAVSALTSAMQRSDPLAESIRDGLLIDKSMAELRRHTESSECIEAIVKASVILFDFTEAIALRPAPDGRRFMPVALAPGRQRLAGLMLPATPDSFAGRAATRGQPAILTPADDLSVAEEQLLRFFRSEALVVLPVKDGQDAEGKERHMLLLGGATHANARRLADRLPLLREFGGQAGSVLGGITAGHSGQQSAQQLDRREGQRDLQVIARQVAHEVSNPLAIIRNYLSVLQRKADSAQPIHTEVDTIAEELDRVANVIHAFAQPQQAAPSRILAGANCDANAAIRYVARLFTESGTLPSGMQIVRHTSPEPAIAAVDETILRQVLINLVKNAVEAMSHGGRIDLRVAGAVERDNDTYIEITVSDTGPGIPKSVQHRLFQPVASSKQGANRGLGLSIVHDLVRRFNGHIEYRTGDAGTQFQILLPTVQSTHLNGQSFPL